MTVALKLARSAGRATLTTVLSMKAMLLPRMAAARIQGPDCGAHGAWAGEDLIAASSQGERMRVWMRPNGGGFGAMFGMREGLRAGDDFVGSSRDSEGYPLLLIC